MTSARPPRLAEYRENIHPVRGRLRADIWFVAQVLGFLWRDNRLWAALLGGALVARTALDWLVPTVNFHSRSTITTVLVVGILLCAGFSASWRSRSPWAGMVAGIMSVSIAAIISMLGAIWLLAFFHDQRALAAVQASGGLDEVFTLPMILVGPGAVLGSIGGVFGYAIRHLRPAAS